MPPISSPLPPPLFEVWFVLAPVVGDVPARIIAWQTIQPHPVWKFDFYKIYLRDRAVLCGHFISTAYNRISDTYSYPGANFYPQRELWINPRVQYQYVASLLQLEEPPKDELDAATTLLEETILLQYTFRGIPPPTFQEPQEPAFWDPDDVLPL